MASFDLNSYETVKERKARFREKHADGRITVKLINPETIMEKAVVEARIYKDASDQEKDFPLGIGYALEIRDMQPKIGKSGQPYESVNYTSWLENCEESAIGRALDNGGFASNKGPSREEMEKVQRNSAAINKPTIKEDRAIKTDATTSESWNTKIRYLYKLMHDYQAKTGKDINTVKGEILFKYKVPYMNQLKEEEIIGSTIELENKLKSI